MLFVSSTLSLLLHQLWHGPIWEASRHPYPPPTLTHFLSLEKVKQPYTTQTFHIHSMIASHILNYETMILRSNTVRPHRGPRVNISFASPFPHLMLDMHVPHYSNLFSLSLDVPYVAMIHDGIFVNKVNTWTSASFLPSSVILHKKFLYSFHVKINKHGIKPLFTLS